MEYRRVPYCVTYFEIFSYDDLFEIELRHEVTFIGFADNVVLVTTSKTEHTVMQKANIALFGCDQGIWS